MAIDQLKSSVLDHELCTGCGACGLVCPEQVIRFDSDAITPIIDFDSDICGGCNACFDVCPGFDTATDESEISLFGRTRNEEERWLGIYSSYSGMCSTDDKTYEKSASGGATTTLALSTSEWFNVRWFLTMGRNKIEGWRAAPSLSETRDTVISTAQSTYQLAPYLQELREVYEEHPDDLVCVVGLACHMQALRKLQALNLPIGIWARDKIVMLIETACSSNTLPSGTAAILKEEAGVDPSEISDLNFREGPYPGNFQAIDHDDKKLDVPFWKILDHLKKNKTFRCLSCGDWMSGLADISVCDGDPNIFDASINGASIGKHCRVIVRTEKGSSLVNYCVDSKLLESWEIDLLGFNLGLERKRSRRQHYETLGRPLSKSSSVSNVMVQEIIASDDELINPERYK